MSNRGSKNDKKLSAQLQLFSEDLSVGSLEHLSLGIKQRMSKMLNGQDRYIVAAIIGRVTGIEVKGSTFEKILSSDPAYQPTAVQMFACCALAHKYDPVDFALQEIGGAQVVTAEDMKYLRLARLEEKRRELEQEIQQVRAQCGLK